MFGARADESWPADLLDVSQTGIGLILDRAFAAATVLTVCLQTQAPETARTLLVRVRHCTALQEGRWLVGCKFVVQLKDRELRELLANGLLPRNSRPAKRPTPADSISRVACP